MVRPASFDSNGMKKGAWSEEEDNKLRAFVQQFGHENWRLLPLLAGLARCGKSCRLRWVNYLRPGLKRGKFTKYEEDLIIELHDQLGKKWSAIAANLPGRTDNEIKNYWHAHIKKGSKRNGAFTRVTRAKMPQKEQSSEIENCITTDHQEEPAFSNVFPKVSSTENPENVDALNLVADSNSVAQAQINLWTEPCDQTCFSLLNIDLPAFLDEEFPDFGIYQNDMSTFSDSSDGGITSWNSSTAESQDDVWSESLEEDLFDMELWS